MPKVMSFAHPDVPCHGAAGYWGHDRLKPKAQKGRPARRGLFKCSACERQFSVTDRIGFEATHVPLSKTGRGKRKAAKKR